MRQQWNLALKGTQTFVPEKRSIVFVSVTSTKGTGQFPNVPNAIETSIMGKTT